jgi:hypothetical protein
VVVLLVASGRNRLTDTGYGRAMRLGAVLLAAAGVMLLAEFLPQAITG